MASLPSNVHLSSHPLLRAKLSLLRSQTTSARDTKALVHEIATILSCEALADVEVVTTGTDTSPLGYEYPVETIASSSITLVPILRSGLSMVEAIQNLLPEPTSVHHLGLFREPTTLSPVEYYNNLPSKASGGRNTAASKVAIVLDPIIATGGTAAAAIQTLREWGVEKVVLLSVLASRDGVTRAAGEWPEGVEIWVGGVDAECDAKGMIKPGLGDVGDRLYKTLGK